MWIITKRELRNYFKNPILWIGLVIVIFGVSQQLFPYLKLHYFQPGTELPDLPVEEQFDAEVMSGYIPSTKERQMSDAYKKLKQTLTESMGYSEEEAEGIVSEAESRNFSALELDSYLEEQYSYLGGRWLVEESALHKGTVEEINAHIEKKMSEHPYSYYLSRKFADFGGLFMGFFATILLAFLFVRDTKGDTYELLHTKPVSSRAYILGKVMGGFLAMLAVLGLLNLIFGIACGVVGSRNGFPVNYLDFPVASILYIVPNLLMITCIYTMISMLFKSPYPAVPLMFVYQVYSNMGSRGADGIYGYYGRPLAIMVRFPGRFLDTAPPPFALWNQLFLLAASALIICLAVQIWKRRRVY